MMNNKVLISILLLSFFYIQSNTPKKDSLIALVKKNIKADTNRIKALNSLTRYYLLDENNVDASLKTCSEAIMAAEKAKSNHWLGKMHSLNAYIKSNYTIDFKGAIDSYFSALTCFEKENNLPEIYTVCLNLGTAFYQYNELDNANTYFKKAEKLALIINNENDLADIYGNLGAVNGVLNNDSLALIYYHKARFYNSNLGNELGLATIDYNIANLNIKENRVIDNSAREEAIKVFRKTKAIFKKYEVSNDYLSCILSLGIQLTKLNKLIEGNDFLKESEKLALEINDYDNLITIYDELAFNAKMQGNIEAERNYLRSYILYNDSLFQKSKAKAIAELQTKYETDKKEKENDLLTLENKNKKLIIYFALGGCVLLLVLVFFIFKSYKNKQKAHKELEVKNTVIYKQKAIVEEQHQDITDSIKYAQRIQGAILPPKNIWQKLLPNSFVLYMPKDILSGDFYWIEETKDYIYVAAADCTGHGVPGALISIVNFNLLNKAVLEKNLVTPSEILDAVNLWLTESLHQTIGESTVRDGMDVALIAIHKHSNEVLFAGANNPIYVVSQEELKQIKGDKFPVGAFVEDQIQKFTTKRFFVNKGDTIYLFSDGFADQFGGEKGKKYKYSPFQEKLKEINDLPLTEQSDKMEEEFIKWKGNHEQVDDVLLIGIKIG